MTEDDAEKVALLLPAYTIFTSVLENTATLIPPTMTVRQLLIFLKFALFDMNMGPISLAMLKDTHDREDAYGGKLFAKTSSAAFDIFFDDKLGWLTKETDPNDSRVKRIVLTEKGLAVLGEMLPEAGEKTYAKIGGILS